MRVVLHVRIPSFFAEAELQKRPELAGKPVIVAMAKGSSRGLVLSASADATNVGVKEGMSVRCAKRICPQAVVLPADNDFYRQLFEIFLDILAQYSPLLEPDSPNGAYIDVTASQMLFGDPVKIGTRIIEKVQAKLGLAIVIGCASNKLVAGILSRSSGYMFESFTTRFLDSYIVQTSIGLEAKVISQSPVTALDSVNWKIAKQLRDLGITKVGQLAIIPEKLLIRRFGPAGSVMKKQSLGIDMRPVKDAYPAETIIIEHVFGTPPEEPVQIESCLAQMASSAAAKLKKRGMLSREITLKLFDESGVAWGGERPLQAACFRFKKPTDSTASITQALSKMLYGKIQRRMEICRVRIVLSDLTPGEGYQLCLIGGGDHGKRIGGAVDLIRERFGENSIFFASSLLAKDYARLSKRIAA